MSLSSLPTPIQPIRFSHEYDYIAGRRKVEKKRKNGHSDESYTVDCKHDADARKKKAGLHKKRSRRTTP